MPFTFVRPSDARLLEGRPLLDLGTGDGQTLRALVTEHGLVVGLDQSVDALRAAAQSGLHRIVAAMVQDLPFADGSFAMLMAGDVFHHLDDAALRETLSDVRRVLIVRGRIVAWWYAAAGRPAPDAPRFPRSIEAVAAAARSVGFDQLTELELLVDGSGPPTVGLLATR